MARKTRMQKNAKKATQAVQSASSGHIVHKNPHSRLTRRTQTQHAQKRHAQSSCGSSHTPAEHPCAMKTPWHSERVGALAQGCSLCVQGKKLVLFITGLCGQRCFYCPVSEHKFGKDVVYANEWKIADPENPVELLEEARLTDAKGAGITGGDPLVKVDRCCAYIRLLKKTFGKKFHMHLYTPLQLVTRERLAALFAAGLDEIRFHPHLHDKTWWARINLAREFSWSVGVEIPAVPGREDQTRELIDFIADKVDFINFNELELSDTTASHYALAGMFRPKDKQSYGVAGSAQMAARMLAHCSLKKLRAHFCTAKLKDGVQLRQRIIRRAKNAKLPFDVTTPDGTLLRGVIYLPHLTPLFGYRKKLAELDPEDARAACSRLAAIHAELCSNMHVPPKDIVLDEKKYRLLAPGNWIRKHAQALKDRKLLPAIVEEYPTADSMEVEIEML